HSMLRARGAEALERLERGQWWSIRHWASRLRAVQAARLAQAVPEEALPFVLAAWLGYRGEIAEAEYDAYVAAGTAHILAVSGVHIGVFFISVSFVLGLFLKDARARAALVMAGVVLFAFTAGGRVSSLRAAFMIGVYVLADLFDRERDTPTALSISAIVFLLASPDLVFDPGFQLSFLSVASILVFAGPFHAGLAGLRPPVSTALATSVGVQILPLPIAIRSFHVIPFAAPLANLIVVPLLTAVLWLCFLTTLASWVSPGVALLFGHALGPAVASIRWVGETVAATPGSHRMACSPTPHAMACYWAAAALAAYALGEPRRRRAAATGAMSLLAIAFLLWRPVRPEPAVVFLDVGHGDAAFVQAADGSTVLVDGGDRSPYHDMGKRVVAPFLWSQGVLRLDCVVLSHPDRDHIGGLAYVLRRFEVGQVVLGPVPPDHAAANELIALCAERGIPMRRAHRGDTVAAGGLLLEVLHPPPDWAPDASCNDRGLVIRLPWMGLRVLFPGDIEALAEAELGAVDCRAEILKAPHHGSGTSSSAPFLDAVSPGWAVVSSGGPSGREGIDAEVLRRYAGRRVAVWRTDLAGAVRVTLQDGTPTFEGCREHRGYPVCTPGSARPVGDLSAGQ
ncbi:MAG: DNA internalization-related competence protein ComEC/Rec2, partial [Candidatus Hydrogenedentes bacterium]|nr:DNA internalization-related competence protein ComEC/Rec2 [Candidatus Hydrogenedentota bacterium]